MKKLRDDNEDALAQQRKDLKEQIESRADQEERHNIEIEKLRKENRD